MTSKPTYRADIDGLRALSVVSVLLFHCNELLPGGFVGVDIFFVISGYLITRLLLKEFEQDHFNLGNFWERRLRRILPPLATVLAPTLVLGYILLGPAELVQLGEMALAQPLMSANIFQWQQSGYFSAPSEFKPLLHTWSLAVEEQFYIFYPIVLYLVFSKAKRATLALLTSVFATSLILNIVLIDRIPSATFYLLPTRAWELLGGGIIATRQQQSSRCFQPWFRELLSVLGLILMCYGLIFFNSSTLFPGVAGIAPVAGAMLFIHANSSKVTRSGELLSIKPMVGIGLISYSLYLWHWPILAFLRHAFNDCGTEMLLTGCLASVILAVFSFHFVEQPFRKKRVFSTRKQMLVASSVYALLVGFTGLFFHQASGIPSRFSADELAMFEDVTYSGEEFQTTTSYLNNYGFRTIGDKSRESFDFLVVGDSHAMAVLHVFDEVARSKGLRGAVATNHSTIPLVETWSIKKERTGLKSMEWNTLVRELRRRHGIKNVVLVAAWNNYLSMNAYAVASSTELPTQEGASSALENGIRRTLEEFKSESVALWVFRQAPEALEPDIARQFVRWKRFGTLNSRPLELGLSHRSQLSHSLAEKNIFEGTLVGEMQQIINIADYFYLDSDPALHYEKTAFYRDSSHISKSGATKFYHVEVSKLLESIVAKDKRL